MKKRYINRRHFLTKLYKSGTIKFFNPARDKFQMIVSLACCYQGDDKYWVRVPA